MDTAADGRRRGLALWLMVSAQFIVILDFSIVNVALPTIQRSLRFSPVGVEGVITAYATAFGGALILGGRSLTSSGAAGCSSRAYWPSRRRHSRAP